MGKTTEELFNEWWNLDENRDLRMPMYSELPFSLKQRITPEEFLCILKLIGTKIKSGMTYIATHGDD